MPEPHLKFPAITSAERLILVEIYRLIRDWNYHCVDLSDLDMIIPDCSWEQITLILQALQKKHLIELQRNEPFFQVTGLLFTNVLSQEAQEVLRTTISFQNAFGDKPVRFIDLRNNVCDIADDAIPSLTQQLAKQGFLLLLEDGSVHHPFPAVT